MLGKGGFLRLDHAFAYAKPPSSWPLSGAELLTLAPGTGTRGLRPNALWQIGITHTPAFKKLSFGHVAMDTFSHVITASARSGKTTKDVIQHLFHCFSQIRLPKQIKTDNAPAYTSAAFKRFCQQFSMVHSTEISYNPQGQTILKKHTHQTLKNQIAKLRQRKFKYSSPHHVMLCL